jgi:hypothetical protein
MGLLCLGSSAFGQAARFDSVAQTTTTVSATNTTVLVPLPGATVTVCTYPSNGTLPCTNKASICPGVTVDGSCTSSAPNNPITADSLGNFGFWAPGGSYDYTICAVSGVCQGPYHAVLGQSNGANGNFTVDGVSYTTIQAAITAAGTTGYVIIPASYAGVDVYTNPNKIQIDDRRKPPNRERGYINMLTDCGLKGDGVTDDSAAANACLAAYPGTRFYFPPTNFTNSPSYFFASSLTPIGNTTVITGGANGWLNSTTKAGSTVLQFAAGVTGIDIQSCGCTVEYISLLGSEGTQNMVNPVLLNFPSGANLPLFARNISSIQRATNVLTVVTSRVNGQEGLTQQVGSTVKIAGVTGDTTMNGLCVVATLTGNSSFGGNPTGFTCAQNGADAGPFGAVGTISLPTTGASTADGIHVCNNFVFILHVTIQNFGRHGINADSLPGHGCASPFSDDLVVRDTTITNSQGEGFLCDGTDCNAGLLESNAFYYNLLWAVEDQSSLGNSYQANQISNNGSQWASGTTPATKAISSISRTLTGNSSTVSVVLSVADSFAKLGSCMVIAGVTDTSFNTAAGQCFFITSFTDSTHFSYIQPGAPADASSSGGTSRMAKFSEAYLSSGIDSGALKVATQSPVSSPALYATYVEGGQYCKFGPTALSVGGVGAGCGLVPSATPTSDFTGQFIGTACTGLGATTCIAAPVLFSYPHDFGGGINFRSGFTTDATFGLSFLKFNSTPAWGITSNPAGTAGATGSLHITSQGFGQTRAIFLGVSVPSFGGVTAINAEGTGYVAFNLNSTGTNSGTGGVRFYAGGAGDGLVGSVDNTGLGTFNGGVKVAAAISPTVAGAQTAGTNPLPFSSIFIGNAATNNIQVTGTATTAKVATLPDNTGTIPELNLAQNWTALQTFNSGLAAGASGSTISDSRELVQSAHECGTTTACANTANLSERMITGTVPFPAQRLRRRPSPGSLPPSPRRLPISVPLPQRARLRP